MRQSQAKILAAQSKSFASDAHRHAAEIEREQKVKDSKKAMAGLSDEERYGHAASPTTSPFQGMFLRDCVWLQAFCRSDGWSFQGDCADQEAGGQHVLGRAP